MSCTEIYKFNSRGKAEGIGETRNAWRGAHAIWTILEDKYLMPYFPSWGTFGEKYNRTSAGMGNPLLMKEIWDLADDDRVSNIDKIVLGSTFDNAVVMRKDIPRLLNAFEEFEGETSLKEQAKIIADALVEDSKLMGIAWNQTSVNESPWGIYDDRDRYRPYNIKKDTKHWSVFDELELKPPEITLNIETIEIKGGEIVRLDKIIKTTKKEEDMGATAYIEKSVMEFTYKKDPIKPLGKSLYQKPTALRDNIKGTVFHKNFLEYLSAAYSSHYGIVVRPDHIWYTILCEMATIVKGNPEKYRALFTDSDKKKEILVLTADPIVMPINILIDELFRLIPPGLDREVILLNFSTTDTPATFAFSTSFLDAASPYYNYSMYLCEYNKIKVLGNVDDYQLIAGTLEYLRPIVGPSPLFDYFTRVLKVIQKIIDKYEDRLFWKEIFFVRQCGSGHQEEAKGWFTDLFVNYPRVAYVSNFPTHLSTVEYKNISTDKEFVMSSGLLSSIIEDDYMIPNFEFYVNEKPATAAPETPGQRFRRENPDFA